MKSASLLFLRFSIGLLMVIWGVDKLVNVEHGIQVSDAFYWGLLSAPALLRVLGVLEVLLGAAVILGLGRRFAYPVLAFAGLFGAVSVWRSIVDPWGWVLEGTNVLFYPSLIILAGSLVLWAFTREDALSLDHRLGLSGGGPEAPAPETRRSEAVPRA